MMNSWQSVEAESFYVYPLANLRCSSSSISSAALTFTGVGQAGPPGTLPVSSSSISSAALTFTGVGQAGPPGTLPVGAGSSWRWSVLEMYIF